mgnify:CR=1 FL=1
MSKNIYISTNNSTKNQREQELRGSTNNSTKSHLLEQIAIDFEEEEKNRRIREEEEREERVRLERIQNIKKGI